MKVRVVVMLASMNHVLGLLRESGDDRSAFVSRNERQS
jgi:hypothetical protein